MRRIGTRKQEHRVGKRASAPKIPPTSVPDAPIASGEIKLYTFEEAKKTPVLCKDFREWAEFMQPHGKVLALEEIEREVHAVVFTGYSYEEPPRLFEYVTYGGEDDGSRVLFATHEEAIEYMRLQIKKRRAAVRK